MAARLRGLTDRCIFCTFSASARPQLLTHRLPGTAGTPRFRSVKTKPALRVLTEFRNRAQDYGGPRRTKPPSSDELHRIVDKIVSNIKPPPPQSGQKHYDGYPNDYRGYPIPTAVVQRKFVEFRKSVLAGIKRPDFIVGDLILSKQEAISSILIGALNFSENLNNKFYEFLRRPPPRPLTPTEKAEHDNRVEASDLRYPQEWYPVTRQFQRTWYLHVGPTNSGKTYHALKRLMESGSGIYAGPLRLLAHEVFERLNAQQIPCNLVTGDDRRIVSETAQIFASTVEMVDLCRRMKVCVLDEIQMIGDTERGWAWTQALMGVKAEEVHLCGEERTVELIQKLAASMGEKLIIQHYNRLGPLEMMEGSLGGNFDLLEKGDCVVTFSRKNIFALKHEIELKTGKKCAVIYGSLPPETRSIQAKLFNDPDSEYDILVASDAVGMGLNLSVKRMIFETTWKFNGSEIIPVPVPSIKQIAGRAGRFRVAGAATDAAPSVGLVTSLDKQDYSALCHSMCTTPKPIKTAGIFPNITHIEEFAALFPPETYFDEVLAKIEQYSTTTESMFHLCSLEDHLETARAMRDIEGLSVAERLKFCMAPISRDSMVQETALEMAQLMASSQDAGPLNIKAFDLNVLDIDPRKAGVLKRLEGLHKALLLYLWLSYRFPATFTPRETAQELKMICEEKIDIALRSIKLERQKLKVTLPMMMAGEEVTDEVAVEELDEDDIEDMEEEGESVVPNVRENEADAEGVVPDVQRLRPKDKDVPGIRGGMTAEDMMSNESGFGSGRQSTSL